jgi:hypothetical protein
MALNPLSIHKGRAAKDPLAEQPALGANILGRWRDLPHPWGRTSCVLAVVHGRSQHAASHSRLALLTPSPIQARPGLYVMG